MRHSVTRVLVLLFLCGFSTAQTPSFSPALDTKAIPKVMQAVADWQLANPSKRASTDWTHGALFAGLVAWAEMAPTDTYLDACLGFGLKNDWQLGDRPYHADDHAVAQMYLTLYERYKDPAMIAPLIERFDMILANQPDTPLTHDKGEHKKRYNWCDALFMAPPVWTRLASLTGNQAYLNYANKEWWATTKYLYDTEEHLYFRDDRFFDKREANGKKIFWCRGNGWVFGGLVKVLANLPDDYEALPAYVKLYRQMAAKLLTIQGEDGLWRSSLLDPVTYPPPEASGSGFYCYGLAWGINRGLLDAETYLPAVKKAWQGLVGCVHQDGKLGWVQPIGAAPGQVSADLTQIYGVGSFLLAGSEVFKIALRDASSATLVRVTNPITLFRPAETLSLPYDKRMGKAVTVLDFKTNRLLTTQITHDRQLLFQSDLAPGERRCFWILPQTSQLKAPKTNRTTFGRFVPERKDDFAWENDRIAYRMYGPALEDETITPGIDVWVKKVDYPIVNKWYQGGDYHKDHGEGADFYKVGPTLGCGGLTVYENETLSFPRNFVESKVLDNGPIRTTFELTYAQWEASGIKLSEVKRISLDLGSNLNRIESHIKTRSRTLQLATGIVRRKGGQVAYDLDGRWLAYQEPKHAKNGTTYAAMIAPGTTTPTLTDKHLLLTCKASGQSPYVYYAGAGWDQSGQFENFGQWQQYTADFAQRIRRPITIRTTVLE